MFPFPFDLTLHPGMMMKILQGQREMNQINNAAANN
jgi:hypothetical protein